MDSGKQTIKQETEKFITLNFKPSELKKSEYTKKYYLNTPELVDLIEKETLRGAEGLNDLKVENYHRDATPFSLLILTLIGVSIASRKVRGGSGFHLAVGIILASLFILTDRFATDFVFERGIVHLTLGSPPDSANYFPCRWQFSYLVQRHQQVKKSLIKNPAS
jgi:lipopolysaccharide export system permease protein